MRTFVMGDIHGAAKAVEQCLSRSRFDFDRDTLIQLGDVTDGYTEVYESVEILLQVRNLIAIKGNHDAWFDAFLATELHTADWTNGGKGTIVSYLKHAGKAGKFRASRSGYKTALVPNDIPQSHQAFFASQKLFHIDADRRCFVHGGFNRDLPIDGQWETDYYWDRELWMTALAQSRSPETEADKVVFPMVPDCSEIYLGHTPTLNWKTDKPMQAFHIRNLDTGAGYTGKLTIMDVESKNYWQSDPLPELYAENFRE